MKKKILIYIAAGVLICAAVLLTFSSCGFFLPVYSYENDALIVNGKPYGDMPVIDWYPKGNKVLIGKADGYSIFFPMRLCRYDEDKSNYFIYEYPFYACYYVPPLHRLDITFPSFSADIIDYVELDFPPNMIHEDNYEYKTIKITDPINISKMAEWFSVQKLKIENEEWSSKIQNDEIIASYDQFGLYAESNQYEGLYYKLDTVIYNGQYYFYQNDRTMYEIPHSLLEQITGLDLFTPAEYQAVIEFGRETQFGMWKTSQSDENFYLFLSSGEYVIFQITDDKATPKEDGFYKLDNDMIRFYPNQKEKAPYSFNADLEYKRFLPIGDTQSYGWVYDEEGVGVQYRDGWYSIKQVASEYLH